MSLNYTHLTRVAFAYSGTAVGRFALYKVRKGLVEEGYCNDEDVVATLLLCKNCSEKLKPGENCRFWLERVKKKPFKNCVVYECNYCKTKTRIKGAPKQDERKPNQKMHLKFSETDLNKLLDNVPENHRTLAPKKRKKEQKKSLIDSFFSAPSNSNSLYNLFH